MKKIVLISSFLFMIVGCDPLYHLNYIVNNQSEKTICIVNRGTYDTLKKIVFLKPGSCDTISRYSGVGYAKSVFQSNTGDILKDIVFFSDTIMNDSYIFLPKGKWNYSELNRCEGKAILIVKSADLKK
ncbi:MAG: hypothetical protein NT084_04375 [Bacteroidetes bacterium]|nr:hypothetical protein [Bacteroidota bacterium]